MPNPNRNSNPNRKVPILEHYEPKGVVTKVDANCAPEDVWSRISSGFLKLDQGLKEKMADALGVQ